MYVQNRKISYIKKTATTVKNKTLNFLGDRHELLQTCEEEGIQKI